MANLGNKSKNSMTMAGDLNMINDLEYHHLCRESVKHSHSNTFEPIILKLVGYFCFTSNINFTQCEQQAGDSAWWWQHGRCSHYCCCFRKNYHKISAHVMWEILIICECGTFSKLLQNNNSKDFKNSFDPGGAWGSFARKHLQSGHFVE